MHAHDASSRLLVLSAVAVLTAASAWFVEAVLAQAPPPANAPAPQKPIVYPAKGQSAEQQSKDSSECYTWAGKQTGFDPVEALHKQQAQSAALTQQTQSQQAQAQRVQSATAAAPARGAAGGAAAGAAMGAIAGNAGKGAAIGAVAGVLSGGAQRAAARQQAQQQTQQQAAQAAQLQSQQSAATNQHLSNYLRSFQACMQGRGYSVVR